jgi:hypothetical protein
MAYYRRAYAPRPLPNFSKPYSGVKAKAVFMYAAEDVWAAAAAATHINGGYLKEATFRAVTDDNGYTTMVQDKEANKVMVRNMLATGNKPWDKADVERGAAAREYWKNNLLKLLSGAANDFEQTAINLANKEQIESVYDVSVISSLIASAERALARDAVKEVKAQTNSKHQGKIGERLDIIEAEVISIRLNADFGKYRVDVRSNDNLYSWWSSKNYEVGARVTVKGKVKSHYADRDTNVAVTQLNYVKEV